MIWDENPVFLKLSGHNRVVDWEGRVIEDAKGNLLVFPKDPNVAMDYLLRGKKIFYVAQKTAMAFKEAGFHTRSRYHADYVMRTSDLADLEQGKISRAKRYIRKLQEAGIVMRPYEDKDFLGTMEVFDRWKNHQETKMDNAKWMITGRKELERSLIEREKHGLTVLVAEDTKTGRIVGVTSGGMMPDTVDYWYCHMGKCDLEYKGLAEYMWHELAKKFVGVEYELDGGSRTKGLHYFKSKYAFITYNVYTIWK